MSLCGTSPTARSRSGSCRTSSDKFPQFDTDPNAYYRPYPEFSQPRRREPVHPQIVAENGPDSAHFHYVHGATVTPVCLNWEAVDEEWRFLTGWPDVRSDDPNKMALYIHSHFSGLGFAISAFEGSSNHRLIFACTPVEDGYSDMFYSIWWPRLPGDTSDVPPDTVREQVERILNRSSISLRASSPSDCCRLMIVRTSSRWSSPSMWATVA